MNSRMPCHRISVLTRADVAAVVTAAESTLRGWRRVPCIVATNGGRPARSRVTDTYTLSRASDTEIR
jgi:hypothetical protein